MHKKIRLALIPILIVAMTALTGCVAGLANGSVENALESALEKATDGELEVDLNGSGGAELPQDWSANVPVPPGDIISAATFGGSFSITVTMRDAATARAHVDTITNAGFTEVSAQTYEGGGLWILTNDRYQVGYNFAVSEDDGSTVSSMSIQKVGE